MRGAQNWIGRVRGRTAADAPHIHLVVVVAVREQTLRCAVPAGADVLGVRLLAVDAAAGAKVGQLQHLVADQNILRLDVAVEDAVAVHVVHRLHQLVHVAEKQQGVSAGHGRCSAARSRLATRSSAT